MKWYVLAGMSLLLYLFDTKGLIDRNGPLVFFLFLICLFLPFAFIQSGGSENNAYGYVFLLVASLTYLFDGRRRLVLVLLLCLVYIALLVIEHTYPQVIHRYGTESQFTDRLIQMPLQFLALFLIVRQFAQAYHQTFERLQRANRTDHLTGLYNRSYFQEMAGAFLLGGGTGVLLMADLDDFKLINDSWGHLAGDAVLIDIARILKESFEDPAVICRWGGEEFMVLIPDVSSSDARESAERMRKSIAENLSGQGIGTTCSIGITEILPGKDLEMLIEEADEMLYAAKHGGKDRIEVHHGGKLEGA